MKRLLKYALQPLLILGTLLYWYFNRDDPAAYPLAILTVQIVLGVLEHIVPARPEWVQGAVERIRNVVMVGVLVILAGVVAEGYATYLAAPLAHLRVTLGLDVWPHHWPIFVQLFMVFFLSEFIWYWVHRAEHRWPVIWRISGHGAHHSFKNLGAINFGANHPLELFFITLPTALVELFFGVGAAAAGAAVLAVTQASIAHTNLDLNTRVIGWLFTTNAYHIRHHSAVLEESNTNYGCSAIVWDRLFGTFADSRVEETGIGPTEPTLWQKFIMPVKEPEDSAVAPGGETV